MDLEASIVERLQKLRQWQIEQQERLLKQQQMQRDILSHKQDCIYKALELSIQGLDLDEDVSKTSNVHGNDENVDLDLKKLAAINNILHKDDNCVEPSYHDGSYINKDESNNESLICEQSSVELCTPVKAPEHVKNLSRECSMEKVKCGVRNYRNLAFTPQKNGQQVAEYFIDGVEPLPLEKVAAPISIDDVPVPSPKKDFQTLLEERLRDCENISGKEHLGSNLKAKIKKPFLRKGQGLSRFKLDRPLQPSVTKLRQRSASLSSSTRSNSKCNKNETKHKGIGHSSKHSQPRKSTPNVSLAQQQLCLKNVPLPKKKVRSKSESASQTENTITQRKKVAELNTSDFRTKTQNEMDEVRMFELLEEKAENSSFCSTSSTVVAFLQQSTPFKLGTKLPTIESGSIRQQTSPIVKHIKDQSITNKLAHYEASNGIRQQSKQRHTYASYNQSTDSLVNSPSSVNLNESQSSLVMDKKLICGAHANINSLEDVDENNKTNKSLKTYTSLRNHIQRVHNQQNSYDNPNAVNSNEVDVSLHVRFSEYNEYKTIGLTDTSTASTESLTITTFCDDKAWNDSFTQEASDTDVLAENLEHSQSPTIITHETQNNHRETKSTQYNASQEVNYEAKTPVGIRQNNDFIYNDQLQKKVYRKEESESSDIIDQSSDDEQTISVQYDGSKLLLQTNNNYCENGTLQKRLGEDDTRKTDMYLNAYTDQASVQDKKNKTDLREMDETIFKSELLKNRLLELEKEIDIFRKENAALSLQRQKLQEDHRKLRREYAEKEKSIEENKKQAEDRLQEERKKLTREKAALESRLRDSQEKAQQSKLERQEIQNLREEFDRLKEEMSLKESRWNAAQSRHKCQMRILKMENSKLKQEVERLQNLKKSNVKNKGRLTGFSNAKAIHQINRQLNMQNKESHKTAANSSSDSDQKMIEPMMKAIGSKLDVKKVDQKMSKDVEKDYECHKSQTDVYETSQKRQQSLINIAKKRNLYENLIKEVTSDLMETHNKSNMLEDVDTYKFETNSQTKNLDDKENQRNHSENIDKNADVMSCNYATVTNNIQSDEEDNDYATMASHMRISQEHQNEKLSTKSDNELSPNMHTKSTPPSFQDNCKSDQQGIRQIQHEDGHIEYWYSNGNVKKVFPDEGITRMIYYNGDVREIDKNGRVKYFYASTRTWHTTMPDGLEILEFPDGQVERRSHNGTVKVSFPDGSVRILQSDGSEKWALTDGTTVQTFVNGEKILTLPNGQREIHTKAHKRREYPDGTVKLVYPDGTQETRYSNGRTRLKDKDGNLLMDSYQ